MPSRGRGQKRQRTREAEGGDVADEDGDEDGNGAARPSKKRARNGDDGVGHRGDGDDFGGFSGSDSEGHEWHEGLNSEDDDSDIDSDAAFGDSDEERYEGYAFKGSSSKKGGEDSGLEDSESLGSDAIDLAQALDQFSENELEGEKGDSGSESSDDNTSSAESVESDDDDDDENDPVRLESLQALVAGFGGDDDAEGTAEATTGKKKLSLKDLSVFGVDDPKMKQSLKLMGKEEKAAKSGGSKRLDVPLARRQQDRFLRTAAYDKASETLNRWTETVKQNRRADHLVFPLAQNAQDAGLYNRELVPLTQERSGTELENTILAIMEESGLGPSPNSASDKRVDHAGEQEKAISRADYTELQRQRRREREQHSREQARAKRIKKIKSKTYRRIHRKERIREDEVTRQEMLEAGELDSEAEREAHDMRRAMERMGARHKESKWAKLGKKAGRAVWDEEFRTSLTEMASRKDELRRRIDGETAGPRGDDGSESDDDSDMGEEQEKARLLDQLEKAAAYDDDEPESKLMQMKFMQRGEGLRKRENDDLVAQLRRDLQGEGAESSDDLGESRGDVGRRHFGALKSAAAPSTVQGAKAGLGGKQSDGKGAQSSGNSAQTLLASGPSNTQSSGTEPASGGGAWSSQGPRESRSRSKHHNSMKAAELDLSVAMPETKYSAAKKTTVAGTVEDAGDEDELHLPMAVRDQELLKRAFAGADVVGEFLQEKKKAVAEDDEKEVDETLPGWGSWVGDGVSTRELGRHKGRFITKVAGTQRKDRKDFKLERVIVNEKRVKKNQAYRATQLPHPFETRQQYESSLRLPIGQEWMTKETFQESTKPRVIVKQGIITPMSKPMC